MLKTDSPSPHQDQTPKNCPNIGVHLSLPHNGFEAVVYIRLQCELQRELRISDCGLQALARFEIRNPQSEIRNSIGRR